MSALDSILAILTGRKVREGELWRVYDADGNELADAGGVLLQGLHGLLLNNQAVLQAIGGGIGHGKKKKRWIERDGKVLVFDTPEQVESFIDSERPTDDKKPVKHTQTIKPVEIIDKKEISRLSNIYQYRQTLYHASQVNDIDRIISIYRELMAREEDDIEMLLIHL